MFSFFSQALYDYRAQKSDELSFSKGAIITNVNKQNQVWWRGDYKGKLQHWFPANFVQVWEIYTDRHAASRSVYYPPFKHHRSKK